MVNSYNNLSPTTKLLIQSFLAVLGSVLVGVAAAAFQSYTNAGSLDLQALINICLLTFTLLFGKAMHDWVPAHAQDLIKAANEEKAALLNALQQAQQVSSGVLSGQQMQNASRASQSQQQPIIVQPPITAEHIQALSQQIALNLANMAGSPPAPSAPVAPVQPVQQIPFPPQGTAIQNLGTPIHFGDTGLVPSVTQQ